MTAYILLDIPLNLPPSYCLDPTCQTKAYLLKLSNYYYYYQIILLNDTKAVRRYCFHEGVYLVSGNVWCVRPGHLLSFYMVHRPIVGASFSGYSEFSLGSFTILYFKWHNGIWQTPLSRVTDQDIQYLRITN